MASELPVKPEKSGMSSALTLGLGAVGVVAGVVLFVSGAPAAGLVVIGMSVLGILVTAA